MFDLLHKHKTAAQVILFLMTIPFAFFGVDFYFRGAGADDAVATVGGDKITQAEFADSIRAAKRPDAPVDGSEFRSGHVRLSGGALCAPRHAWSTNGC